MWETPAPLHLQTPCRQRFQRVDTQRSRNVHLVATDVALQGGLSSWRRRVVVQFVLLFFFFFLCLEGKRRVAWSIVRELF